MIERPRQKSLISVDPEAGGTGRDRWLLPYADFLTLLLALFVVLYANAQSDGHRDASLFEGIQAAFVFDSLSPAPVPTKGQAPGAKAATEEALAPVPVLLQLEEDLVDVVERTPREPGEDPGVSLHQTERGLIIRLTSTEFFPAGGVAIPETRRAALAAMAPVLAATTASLQFEGHTDDQPVGEGPYPSNWELSSARAAAVARLFIDDHDLAPGRISVIGHAAQRPIADNEDVSSRARNRRVDIVVLEDGELVPDGRSGGTRDALDALLEELPPIPNEVDESLRAAPAGPQPEDIPLP
ncbi:MAG: OmpA family protein [Myxococcota bacterium]